VTVVLEALLRRASADPSRAHVVAVLEFVKVWQTKSVARPEGGLDHVTVIAVVPALVQVPIHRSCVAGTVEVSTVDPATFVHVVTLPPESAVAVMTDELILEWKQRMSPMADVAVSVRDVSAVPVTELSDPLAVMAMAYVAINGCSPKSPARKLSMAPPTTWPTAS
jgi:hypothetical protein